jgi:phosphotransferase system enzyme I (PtsP)
MVKKYYDPYHPAILNSIKKVADVAHAAGKKVSLCGEMAADPVNLVLLLGMGIFDFSLSAPYIPISKQTILNISLSRAKEIAEHALTLESAATVRAYMREVSEELHLRQ